MTPLLLALLAPQPALAQDDDFIGHIDNAKLFIRKRFYADALTELESAVALPDGRIDPEAWYMLANVRYELGDLDGARQAAARAHSYSRTDAQLQEASGFSAFLSEQFGVVVVSAPWAGLVGHLDVELDSILFDPTLKNWLERQRSGALAEKVMLPYRLGLPVGTYHINGHQVSVTAGAEIPLELTGGEIDTRGPASTQLAQAELAFGVSHWLGSAVAHFLPAPTVQLAASQPVGPLVAGVLVDWTPRWYQQVDDTTGSSIAAWTVGARIGWELPNTEPLVVRVSVGYRYGTVPGLPLSCVGDGAEYSCAREGPADVVVYAVSPAHIPHLELASVWLDRTRRTAVGVGMKATLDEAIGILPSAGQAALPEGEVFAYEVRSGSRMWTATGFRVLVNVSLAF